MKKKDEARAHWLLLFFFRQHQQPFLPSFCTIAATHLCHVCARLAGVCVFLDGAHQRRGRNCLTLLPFTFLFWWSFFYRLFLHHFDDSSVYVSVCDFLVRFMIVSVFFFDLSSLSLRSYIRHVPFFYFILTILESINNKTD